MSSTTPEPLYRKIWGRRQGRPLKENQKELLKTVYPKFCISLEPYEEDLKTFNNTFISLEALFPTCQAFALEIGFGGGEHLAWRAQQMPTMGFIGCEPFITGVANLLGEISNKNLENVRIVHDDARLVLQCLPAESLERIYILFPDPWPKKRHHKRRIVHPETIPLFYRVLKPQGCLLLATDIEEYALWMEQSMQGEERFQEEMNGRLTRQEKPEYWPTSRYEQKGLEAGRQGTFFVYRKKE